MRFYAKFTKLTGYYVNIYATNIKKAKDQVAKYRSDAVVYSDDEKVITFDQYHNRSLKLTSLELIQEKCYIETKCSATEQVNYHHVRTNAIDEDLKMIYFHVPGIKHANTFTIAGKNAFGVKNSKAFTEYMMTLLRPLGVMEVPKELKSSGFIPICVFKKVSKIPNESNNNPILAIESEATNDDIQF
jgi:hypothetical protein